MCTETTVSSLLATFLHRRRQPELLKVPIELTKIADRLEILAGGNGSLIVNHAAGRSRITGHLRLLRLLSLGDQAMHVDIDRGFKEARFATVVVLQRRVTRVVINHGRELRITRMINIELDWIS